MSTPLDKRTLPEHLAALTRGRLAKHVIDQDDLYDWLTDVTAATVRLLHLQINRRRGRAEPSPEEGGPDA
jgi:hypothetical protein